MEKDEIIQKQFQEIEFLKEERKYLKEDREYLKEVNAKLIDASSKSNESFHSTLKLIIILGIVSFLFMYCISLYATSKTVSNKNGNANSNINTNYNGSDKNGG